MSVVGGRRHARHARAALFTAGFLVAFACVATSVPGSAAAAVRNVATTAELQAAVRESASGDEIVLERSFYTPVQTLVIESAVTIRGPRVEQGQEAMIGGGRVSDGDEHHLFSVVRGGELTVRDLVLSGSQSDSYIADVFGSMRIENATVTTADGSALVVHTRGSLTLENATVSDNAGSGVIVQPAGVLTVSSSTISGNGIGGIWNSPRSNVTLRNAIVANSNPAGRPDCQAPVQSSVASMDFDGSCRVPMTADPLLGSLQRNGGPTPTRVPAVGSRAIGAGVDCPATDQRYAPRPPGRCDIGSVEAGSVPAPSSPVIGTAPGGTAIAGCRPVSARPAGRVLRSLTARGALPRVAGRRATMGLRLVARGGVWRGGGTYADPRARVRLRLDAPRAIALDRGRAIATFRTTGRDLSTGRRICVTVRAAAGRRSFLTISTTSGYRRAARFAAGGVRLAVVRPARSASIVASQTGGSR